MSLFAIMMIWLLPGTVFALHQGIDHWRGAHIPQIVIFNWEMPHWLLYTAVVLLGPVWLVAFLVQSISSSR